jgi:hypothetical protein
MAMIPFGIPAFIKFLIGALLLQGTTALLVVTVQDADLHRSGWLVIALGLLIGVIAALWFSTIASHASQHSFVRASEKFNRQRDRIRRQAEKEKTREIRDSHRRVLRESKRSQNRASMKLGAAMAGLAGMGVLLFFTQFMTLGLLALSVTGGALLGYSYRAHQNPAIDRQAGGTADKLATKPVGQGRVLTAEKLISPDEPK